MIPLRIYAYLAIALAIGWLVWRNDVLTKRANAAIYQRDLAREQVAVEQEARAHEQAIAKQASTQFQSAVTALQDELAARPLGPVIVRVPVRARADGVPAAATASQRPDAAPAQPLAGSLEIDIERPITDYGRDCAKVAAQLEALQSWVLSR